MVVHGPMKKFQKAMSDAMEARGVSVRELTRFLEQYENGIRLSQVKNMVAARQNVPLHLLRLIAEYLQLGQQEGRPYDPAYFLQVMGLLDTADESDIAELAKRKHQLDLQLRTLQREVAATETSTALAQIALRASERPEWAVAFWPVVAGPEGARFHVEDRIDFRRTDGELISSDELFRHPDWHDILRQTYADASGVPAAWTDLERTRVEFRSSAGTKKQYSTLSSWGVNYAERPRLPEAARTHEGVAAVGFYGLTYDSEVNAIAALVALAIGYGFSSSRDHAMEMAGFQNRHTSWRDRSAAHANWLGAPPERWVWAHNAPPYYLVEDPFAVSRDDTPMFWLRESEEALGAYCERWQFSDAKLEEHKEYMKYCKKLADEHHTNVIEIPVSRAGNADARWGQIYEIVCDVLRRKELSGAANAGRRYWEKSMGRSKFAEQFLNWLGAQI